jgi:hypothetical protein
LYKFVVFVQHVFGKKMPLAKKFFRPEVNARPILGAEGTFRGAKRNSRRRSIE